MSNPSRASTFLDVDGAPLAVLQSKSGLKSSHSGSSDWVSFDASTMSQTDGSSNVAFYVGTTTNGSGFRTDLSSDTDGAMTSSPGTVTSWTPDWCNEGVMMMERVARDAANCSMLDGYSPGCMNGDGDEIQVVLYFTHFTIVHGVNCQHAPKINFTAS